MGINRARFRFYADLNDFLPLRRRQREFDHTFIGHPAVKDVIEGLGVPHAEVELILADQRPVQFAYRLNDQERIAVFPAFSVLDSAELGRLRPQLARPVAFILDVHLGKLARLLRLLGFDTRYRNDFDDCEIIALARQEGRLILTRDRGILKNGHVVHGYCIRSKQPLQQAREVLQRFGLRPEAQPFTRCMACNGLLTQVDKGSVLKRLPPRTARFFNLFYACRRCARIYWKGSHFEQMQEKVAAILGRSARAAEAAEREVNGHGRERRCAGEP